MTTTLQRVLLDAARDTPDGVAIVETNDSAFSFGMLSSLTSRVAARLRQWGLQNGDRVGIVLPKSVDTVAIICGVLQAGGVYVPVDPLAPSARAALILTDCSARLILTTSEIGVPLCRELELLRSTADVHMLPTVGGGRGAGSWSDSVSLERRSARDDNSVAPDSPACILYTSGSTGQPKGVTISHRAVMAFVEWATAEFHPLPADRFASIAPFHFDLSLFDLFVSQRAGAAVVLIDELTSKNPRRLAQLIDDRGITICYSTPTALTMLLNHGRLERHVCRFLRLVLFAGEIFPASYLRQLMAAWPSASYFNLYGPTETNVCTWYQVPEDFAAAGTATLPIGRPCSHARVMVLSGDQPVPVGEIGELVVSGDGLMSGYWNLPTADTRVFLVDDDNIRWYRTGDFVSETPSGHLLFHGRRDRMVKRRGYRIELAEIECLLSTHPSLTSIAVVSHSNADSTVTISAFFSCALSARPSLIELKTFCAARLPHYMIPDSFVYLNTMPTTSTGKIDYQSLASPRSP